MLPARLPRLVPDMEIMQHVRVCFLSLLAPIQVGKWRAFSGTAMEYQAMDYPYHLQLINIIELAGRNYH